MAGRLLASVAEVVARHSASGGDEEVDCDHVAYESECRDSPAATKLKIVAIIVIFLASILGVLIPLAGRRLRYLRPGGSSFMVIKAFAAGVILATAFIHMFPAANDVFKNPCLPEKPWGKFAWAGFIAMLGALGTLVMDFSATEFYMRRHKETPPGTGAEKVGDLSGDKQLTGASAQDKDDSFFIQARHIVVAQVFEFGIVAHSIIIGITVGVSNSPCTIKPLFAALTFHQFFEGVALGGCIAQAGFRTAAAALMGFTFAITTSVGIAIGMGVTTSYNENSPTALLVIGWFDAISAGILVYMSLVDLIAADFLSKRMRSNKQLQACSFIALFLGVAAMSIIGLWA